MVDALKTFRIYRRAIQSNREITALDRSARTRARAYTGLCTVHGMRKRREREKLNEISYEETGRRTQITYTKRMDGKRLKAEMKRKLV